MAETCNHSRWGDRDNCAYGGAEAGVLRPEGPVNLKFFIRENTTAIFIFALPTTQPAKAAYQGSRQRQMTKVSARPYIGGGSCRSRKGVEQSPDAAYDEHPLCDLHRDNTAF